MASAHDTNDPAEIIKNPLYEILQRLAGDSDKLKALAAIDQEVLERLMNRDETPKSRQQERLEQASQSMKAVVRNASEARHALDQYRENH